MQIDSSHLEIIGILLRIIFRIYDQIDSWIYDLDLSLSAGPGSQERNLWRGVRRARKGSQSPNRANLLGQVIPSSYMF